MSSVGNAHTASNTSSSFDFPPTTSFLDLVYTKFVELALLLCGGLEVPVFSLSLHMNFGEGMTSSSTMSAEPFARWPTNNRTTGHTNISREVSNFFHWLQHRFLSLLLVMVQHRLIGHGRRVSMCVDMSVGFVSAVNTTMRVTIDTPMWTPPSSGGLPLNGGNGDDMFRPIPRGMTWANFWATAVHDDMSESMSEPESSTPSNPEGGSMPIEWQPVRCSDGSFFGRFQH